MMRPETSVEAAHPSRKPPVVALTGGIASGKSVVSDRLAELGVPVVDTDVIARQIVEPGKPVLEKIVEHFGNDMLDPSGHLDRAALRARIFASKQDQELLESLMHPVILAEARAQLLTIDAPYAVIVIPLLAEGRRLPWIDRILVVDAPVATQIERLQARDKVTPEQAGSALAAQATRDQRLAIADDIIVNDSSLEALRDAAERQHRDYLARYGREGA